MRASSPFLRRRIIPESENQIQIDKADPPERIGLVICMIKRYNEKTKYENRAQVNEMAKHLAQKSKHELKRERRPREESLPESTESDASAEERTAPPRRRAFKASALLGRFRYLPLVLSAILLLGIPLLPLEGWQRTACYILPLLIVGADLVWIAVRRIRQGEYFCAECVALLAAVLLLASAHGAEAVLLLILLRAAKLLEQFLNDKNDRDL